MQFENIRIDSSYDIAVNKLFTIYQNPRLREFMDLYKLITKFNYNFDLIKADAQIKFGTFIEPVQLGSQLLKVETLEDYPKLIEELDKGWHEFFLDIAGKIGESILD